MNNTKTDSKQGLPEVHLLIGQEGIINNTAKSRTEKYEILKRSSH